MHVGILSKQSLIFFENIETVWTLLKSSGHLVFLGDLNRNCPAVFKLYGKHFRYPKNIETVRMDSTKTVMVLKPSGQLEGSDTIEKNSWEIKSKSWPDDVLVVTGTGCPLWSRPGQKECDSS